jgi:hypothetical protein
MNGAVSVVILVICGARAALLVMFSLEAYPRYSLST